MNSDQSPLRGNDMRIGVPVMNSNLPSEQRRETMRAVITTLAFPSYGSVKLTLYTLQQKSRYNVEDSIIHFGRRQLLKDHEASFH